MKHLYSILIFLISFLSFAQSGGVQLVLVDSAVGAMIYEGCAECSDESNDEGLNAIFLTHNVNWYQNAYAYSGSLGMSGKIHMAACNGCDVNQFLEDLNNYDSVIRIASLSNSDDSYFNHGLNLKLIDDNIGIPTGDTNGIITTNNSDLNQIFIDYNVSLYELVYVGSSYERYELFCDCDATQLKQELDNLSSVVLSSNYLDMIFLLSTNEYALNETKIHPNPFTDKVTVDTNAQISQLVVYDVLGKEIFNSNSVAALEDFSSSLSSGIYVIKLFDSENRSITRKLIKQ